MTQQANTIILEMTGADKDDINDLRNGEGKIFRKIRSMIEQLKQQGEVDENAQPVIAIVQKKKDKKGLLD
ncbi:MAG: hypothetical protein F6K48_09380 [Okeania sp. SIO3H1]|uniref:DUF6200 domain-containing protein n=1 Tax=Okeania sp. SIO1I7 TaxID=2607772 RepID=UPI0013C8D1EA|nr:hypothetical protein [Okeania sp. SIO1I7]NEN89102.1 hypothetical protein [Okeania sp. SIO3H1]NET25420.1 hypothetical protein [Okeania sp. SIO1I7]